jgi:hypothetical protein
MIFLQKPFFFEKSTFSHAGQREKYTFFPAAATFFTLGLLLFMLGLFFLTVQLLFFKHCRDFFL